MVLRSLYQLYDRLEGDESYDVAPPGRTYQKVSFVVVIDPDGTLVDIQDARIERNGKRVPRRVLVLGQTKPPGAGLNPCFLWDGTGYLLGWDPRPDRQVRAPRSFAALVEHHAQVENEVNNRYFGAVCRFLRAWDPERAGDFPMLEELSTGFGVFQVRGETSFVHDQADIQAWWDRHTEADPERMAAWWEKSSACGENDIVGQCLITGSNSAVARTLGKVKGVIGAQPAGATIAGFQDPAYWSYGFKQSYNSPISIEAGRRFTTALNVLLEGPQRDKHRILVGGTTVAFWTDRPTAAEDVFAIFTTAGSSALASTLDETTRAKLEAMLRALRQGREAFADLADDPDHTEFFILGLAAPTPARVAVRFFHRGSVTALLDNLRRHHRDIGIERQYGERSKRPEPELPPVRLLLDETRSPGGDVPPLLPSGFLEAIVSGHRYPDALYTTVMRRIAADRVVNYPRACIVRGTLVRNYGKEIPVSLDTARTDPAYRIGRLFAALEKTQGDALGSQLNATIRDRFYSSASATPAAVIPRLLRTYQHHLAKLEGGFKVNREKLVQEILAPLEGFPAHLGLADQGLFALGYYHQKNDFYQSKSDTAVALEA